MRFLSRRVSLVCSDMCGDLVGEADGTVICRRVADHLAGVDYAPEGVVVTRYSVENLKGYAAFVADILGLDALDEELAQIALAYIGAEGASYAGQVARATVRDVGFAGTTDADLHVR